LLCAPSATNQSPCRNSIFSETPFFSALRRACASASKEISPKTKTIVITGYVDQSIIDEAEKLGRDSFLQKPFDLETLKNEVDRVLGIA
jgi:DNA-binding NtrC family response regulator